MQAVVKGISNDIFDVGSYSPERSDNFCVDLRVRIGLDNSQGADDFELMVCTPKWLASVAWESRWGRGILIVSEYNFPAIFNFIQGYVEGCSGDSWEAIVSQLVKVFIWEFDDYKS